MAHPYTYDDNEMVGLRERVFRDIEALYRWDLAEANIAQECPDCGASRCCDVHRCRATTARGTRCKRHVGDDLLHCRQHAYEAQGAE